MGTAKKQNTQIMWVRFVISIQTIKK